MRRRNMLKNMASAGLLFGTAKMAIGGNSQADILQLKNVK
jgi:hypothetical protein